MSINGFNENHQVVLVLNEYEYCDKKDPDI